MRITLVLIPVAAGPSEDLNSGDKRLPFVREASAGDSDLRRQVESLLAEDPIIVAAGEILNDNPLVPFDFGSGRSGNVALIATVTVNFVLQ